MKKSFILLFIIVLSQFSFADGLLMPCKESYPKNFLRTRLTEVTVNIHGLIAETTVYQEFVNEWYDSTDVVYSFPLPADARATELDYWYNDNAYRAILKVKEQTTNPGTGEGGVAAEVNKYIGRNGIKFYIKNVPAGSIQKIKFHYISLCDFYQGKAVYKYPLNTENFITYPVDNLQFDVNVYSNANITNYGSPSHPNFTVIASDSKTLKLRTIQPKAFLNKDFEFFYDSDHSNLGLDFYSVKSDSTDGHFSLFVRPQDKAVQDSIIPKRIFFMISNSGNMYGSRLNQSVAAISQSLDMLSAKDYFNIIIFNNVIQPWNTAAVKATPENIQNAKNYLTSIITSWGSQMGLGIKECFNQIKDDSLSNIIMLFTDGVSTIDPKEIASLNKYNTGIFPIGIGDYIDRAKLEMTASMNYGFVTYLSENDIIKEKVLRVFNLINQPVLKDVAMEYGRADLYDVQPQKLPSTYAGSYFYTTGRFKNIGESAISIAGTNVNGYTAYNFRLNFSNSGNDYKFVESVWAKEMIDALEREIEIYGETGQLKDSLINISLKYGIRCRYTAYIADYQTPSTGMDIIKQRLIPATSYIAGNYPNPFNPATRIRIYLDDNTTGKAKIIKIFNCLGQLIQVIDISYLQSGWHEVVFNGKDMYGNALPSGIYFVRLQIQNEVISTIKVNLIK